MPVLLNMSSTLTYSICAINSVLKSIPLEELVGLVNEPLTKTAQILDFDKRRGSVTDDEVLDFLHENPNACITFKPKMH